MKTLLIYLLLFLGIGGFQNIAEINSHLQKAEAAFKSGRFAEAVQAYEFVVYEKEQKKPELLLNLAHAYLKNNQADKAQKVYEQSAKSKNPNFRSVAWNHLGTLQAKLPDYKKALTFYKRALIADPTNEQARYNYEMLKKYLRENPEKQNQLPPPAPEKKEKQDEKQPQPDKQEQEEQPQQNQPDQNGDQEKEIPDKPEPGDQEQKPEKETDPEGQKKPEQEKPGNQPGQDAKQNQGEEPGKEKGENLAENDAEKAPEKPNKKPGKDNASGDEKRLQTQYERLRKANISPEKANMMLEAMKNAEQQYLQQLPKKGTKKPDQSKPNW